MGKQKRKVGPQGKSTPTARKQTRTFRRLSPGHSCTATDMARESELTTAWLYSHPEEFPAVMEHATAALQAVLEEAPGDLWVQLREPGAAGGEHRFLTNAIMVRSIIYRRALLDLPELHDRRRTSSEQSNSTASTQAIADEIAACETELDVNSIDTLIADYRSSRAEEIERWSRSQTEGLL